MKLTKTLVTPSMAKKLLETNTSKNRRIKPAVVNKYAKEMAEGRWRKDTAEAIKISEDGALIDGQHRLLAIVKSNKSIELLVASEVPYENFKVIDTGVSRNAGDAFKIEGIKNSNLVPAIISLYNVLKSTGKGASYEADQVPSITSVLDLYYERQNFWQSASNKAVNWYVSFSHIISPKTLGALYALFYDKNQQDATDFMDQLTTGINIKNQTISYLRAKMINDKLSPKKMHRNFKIALIIKTWNFFRKKTELPSSKHLKFDPAKENFPFPV